MVKLLCEDQEMEIHHRYANEIMVIKQHMARNWDFEVLHTKREGNGHKGLQHLNEEDGEIDTTCTFGRWVLIDGFSTTIIIQQQSKFSNVVAHRFFFRFLAVPLRCNPLSDVFFLF